MTDDAACGRPLKTTSTVTAKSAGLVDAATAAMVLQPASDEADAPLDAAGWQRLADDELRYLLGVTCFPALLALKATCRAMLALVRADLCESKRWSAARCFTLARPDERLHDIRTNDPPRMARLVAADDVDTVEALLHFYWRDGAPRASFRLVHDAAGGAPPALHHSLLDAASALRRTHLGANDNLLPSRPCREAALAPGAVQPNGCGSRPLHFAHSSAMVALLVEHRADVNATRLNGCTPLMDACRAGEAAVVRTLCESGANTNVLDKPGGLRAERYAEQGAGQQSQAHPTRRPAPTARRVHHTSS